jgi:hypothetical protein
MADRAVPELSVESRLLIQRLGRMEEDEVITYEELDELTSCRVRGSNYLDTARRRVLIDKGIVIECVASVGVKRIANANLHELGDAALKRMARLGTRAIRKGQCADLAAMSDADRTAHLANMSAIAMLVHFSKPRAVASLVPYVTGTMELPIGRTLEVLGAAREKVG